MIDSAIEYDLEINLTLEDKINIINEYIKDIEDNLYIEEEIKTKEPHFNQHVIARMHMFWDWMGKTQDIESIKRRKIYDYVNATLLPDILSKNEYE